jgi:acyl-CoA thioester hydrolase
MEPPDGAQPAPARTFGPHGAPLYSRVDGGRVVVAKVRFGLAFAAASAQRAERRDRRSVRTSGKSVLVSDQTELRVRYSETDQGGVVYHANYLAYFEVGRTELLRSLGVPYAEFEKRGTRLMVVESHVQYRAPARYDDVLLVRTSVAELRKVRMRLTTEIRRKSDGVLLAEGWLWLASIGRDDRPGPLPAEIARVLGSEN